MLRVAAAQIAPVLLDRRATFTKVLDYVDRAAREGVRLVAFPEAVLPGYPVWLSRTGGAMFDDPLQKQIHARYLDQGVELPGPELEDLRKAATAHNLTIMIGVMERGRANGRGTLWCTALTVHPDGAWTAHRKLVPTYEERLAWGPGDAHGLVVHQVDDWKVSVLNCWENWMPAARLALYAQGTELHVSLWPGTPSNTRDITRFTAREGRVYTLASSGVLRAEDVPADFPARDVLLQTTAGAPPEALQTGGSRILAPDTRELAACDESTETLVIADLDRELLLAERQNFDPAGHYARPDVLQLHVDPRRLETLHFINGR